MNKFERILNKYIFKPIFNYEKTQKIANNAVWIIFDRMIKVVFGMITGIWVARYLGPELFGRLNYATAFMMLFIPLSTLSIDTLNVRDISRNPEKKFQILGTTFILRLIGSTVALSLALLAIHLIKPGDHEMFVMVFILCSCFFFQSVDIIDLFFQSVLKSKYSVYVRTSVFVLFSFVKLALIFLNAPLITFVWAYALEMVFGSIGLLIIYLIRKENIFNWSFSKEMFTGYIGQSWIMILQGFALVSQSKVDQIIIGDTLTANELGQYSVAIRMIDILAFLPLAVQQSYAPSIAEAKIRGEELYLSKLKNLYRIMFYLAIFVGIPVFFIGDDVISFVFGEKYTLSGGLFSLSVFRIIALNMSMAKSNFYINEQMLRFSLIVLLFSAGLNLSLNLLLIPIYHTHGAIMAQAISFLISFFLLDLFTEKTRKNLVYILRSIFFIETKK